MRVPLLAYALETGADPDVTVDEFCRWFPEGDRRAERVVREQAALMGHDLRWNDDLAAERNRRASSPAPLLPPLAFSQTGRIVAALADASLVIAAGLTASATMPIGKASSVALCAILYHARARDVRLLARRVGHRHVCRQSPPGGSRPGKPEIPQAPAKSRPRESSARLKQVRTYNLQFTKGLSH
jgi:hypothetical protein